MRVAPDEDEGALGIPDIVGIVVVRVEPEAITVVIDVEDVQIAVRVGMYTVPSTSPPFEYSQG